MSDTHNHTCPDLPGLDEAIAQLRYDTTAHRDADDPYAGCFPNPLPEIPNSGPVSVDSALSAMITLQLGAAHDAIKSPGMIPPPGALHMIEVPNAGARERVGSIVQAMVDEGSVSGVTPPRVIEQIGAGKSIDTELFQKRIEKSMLRGHGVIAVMDSGTQLPDRLRSRVAQTLTLPPVSSAMLEALLCEIHKVETIELDLSDHAVATLEDLDLAAIFSAPSLQDAQTQLAREPNRVYRRAKSSKGKP